MRNKVLLLPGWVSTLFHFWSNRSFSVAAPDEEVSCFRKALNWFCGLEDKKGPKLSKEEEAALQMKLTDTSENPFWKRVVNINGIILLCVAVFCHGFFA